MSQLRVHRSRRLPSRAWVRSRVVGRTALDFGVLVGGRPNEMEGESARPVRGVSRQQFTNDEAVANPPPPRHLRLRRRVRARAADGAADPVRPACRPAADRGPTGCGEGSTHVHRAIDARTGGGRRRRRAALTVPNPISSRQIVRYKIRTLRVADSGVWRCGVWVCFMVCLQFGCVPRAARQQRKPALITTSRPPGMAYAYSNWHVNVI